jgi:hypothetical protein
MDAPAPKATLSLDTCLLVVIEGYLLNDLKSMEDDIEWKDLGAVCYPMLMAILAGSELLGRLTGGNASQAVAHYWTTFMSRINPLYVDLGAVAQDILRNGLMHTYFTKPGVGVVRKIPGAHLTTDDGLILLDCCVLADDFRESYLRHAKPCICAHRDAAEGRSLEVHRDATQARSSRTLAAIDLTRFPRTIDAPGVGRISGIYVPTGASQYPG